MACVSIATNHGNFNHVKCFKTLRSFTKSIAICNGKGRRLATDIKQKDKVNE
jgi:hypothetical protein